MNKKKVFFVFFSIFIFLIFSIVFCNVRNVDEDGKTQPFIQAIANKTKETGVKTRLQILFQQTDKTDEMISSLVGEWEVTEWSIVHREYTKENYSAEYDNMIGLRIVINEDGTATFGEDEYQFVEMYERDAKWLEGSGIVAGIAERIGLHPEFSFEAVEREDWMGEKFKFSIIISETQEYYVTPCYSMVGGFYSIQRIESDTGLEEYNN